MSDLFRELPLSSRTPRDESGVTGDWRGQLADVVGEAARLLARVDDDSRSPRTRAFLVESGLDRERSEDDLTGLADAVRSGRRRRIRDLSRAVTATLVLARDTGGAVSLASLTFGAVALYRTTAAPLPIRAVVAGRTLRSSDHGWEFGHGPLLEDTSERIVAFLCGVSENAPGGGSRPR